MAINLKINPDLDLALFARLFQEQGVVQIPNFFTDDSAERLYEVMSKQTTWQLAMSDENGNAKLIGDADVKTMGASEVSKLINENTLRSGEKFGFFYLCYPMIEAYVSQKDPNHPLNEVTEFLNSAAMVELARTLSGAASFIKLDAQATCFRPNDFLNLHDDLDQGNRAAAYTIGMTKGWRPDWGGQLLFHTQDGDVSKGLIPRFNVLSLFKVPTLHSVAPIAPYARHPRYSVTGWLRTDPLKPSNKTYFG